MKRIRICLFIALSMSGIAAAQDTLHLTLAEAERLAVANNPQLSAAQFTAQAAAQIPLELRSNFEPTLTGALTGVGADSGSRLAAGALNNPVVYNRAGTGLLLSQLVTDFGRTRNLVDSAKLRAQAQDQVTQTTRAQILLAVTRAYFGALRGEAVLKVAEQTVAARQLVADQVSALARSNLKSTLDVSFANVNLADAKLLLASAQSNVKTAYAELATAIGLPGQYRQGWIFAGAGADARSAAGHSGPIVEPSPAGSAGTRRPPPGAERRRAVRAGGKGSHASRPSASPPPLVLCPRQMPRCPAVTERWG